MAVKSDNSLWAWGENRDGGLADGTKENRHIPAKIMSGIMLPSVKQIGKKGEIAN